MSVAVRSTHRSVHLLRVIGFLRSIDIQCELRTGAHGFIEGVRIERGGLLIDPGALVADVLHEAGHLAVLPGRYRPLAGPDIDDVCALMMDAVDFSDPDTGEARAALQCGDAEATAWAWAAGLHLGLSPKDIIDDAGYGGAGADVRSALLARAYLGINGLSAAGFCVTRENLVAAFGRPAYPTLAFWVQSDFAAMAAQDAA